MWLVKQAMGRVCVGGELGGGMIKKQQKLTYFMQSKAFFESFHDIIKDSFPTKTCG